MPVDPQDFFKLYVLALSCDLHYDVNWNCSTGRLKGFIRSPRI